MAESGKLQIEKFDGKEFGWWKMQMEDLLVQKDLDMVLGDKPEKLKQDEWETLDKKAKAVIRLSLTKDVAFNILKETTARGIMDALSLVPSGEATNPLKRQLPSSSLQAYPAIGVLQDPSSVNRKALSHATANLVSSWFSFAM